MRTIIIAFTQPGLQLAKKAAQNTEGTVEIYGHERCMDTGDSVDRAGSTDSADRADSSDGTIHSFYSVGEVIKEQFYQCDRILFIGAAAIAVRVIAPYLKSKTTDPAVLVADEDGKFLISLLSGHIGGANEWCSTLAERLGAAPVITTATDTRGMFAVDLFAGKHRLRIVNPVMIQDISGRILNHEPVGMTGNDEYIDLLEQVEKQYPGQIQVTKNENGEFESGIQIITEVHEKEVFLRTIKLVPMNLAVGIGCKKGKSLKEIAQAVYTTFAQNHLLIERIGVIASIDRKAQEQGIIDFAKQMKVPYRTYAAQELEQQAGTFTASSFVKGQMGVDNVCEVSACAATGGGEKIVAKTACDGITVAVYKIKRNEE